MLPDECAGGRSGQHNGENRQMAGTGEHGQRAPQIAGKRFVCLGWQALGVVHGRLSACCADSVGMVSQRLAPTFDELAQLGKLRGRFIGVRSIQRPAQPRQRIQ
eukprot:gene39381-53236_t